MINENRKSEHLQNYSLDKALDKLSKKISNFSYEVDESNNFYVTYNWNKLDIPFFNWEDLIKAAKLISHMINTYKEAGFNWKLYYEADVFSYIPSPTIDIKVDNRIIFDTTFLRSERIKEIFGKDTTWWEYTNRVETLVEFLNKTLITLNLLSKKE
jgi:hypothetical protein